MATDIDLACLFRMQLHAREPEGRIYWEYLGYAGRLLLALVWIGLLAGAGP